MRLIIPAVFALLAMAAPVRAQSKPAPKAPASSIGIRGYATFGSNQLAATETFEAVAGKSRHTTFGAGAQVTRVWRQLFVDASFSRTEFDGERVFMDGGNVYKLGIPLSVTFTPIDVAAGWRFALDRRGRFSPFLGTGVSSVSYEETGGFAEAGDNVSERAVGALILGGVDVRLTRWVHIGGEVRYRAVSGVLGTNGVSATFSEDQLGGMSASARVSIGR